MLNLLMLIVLIPTTLSKAPIIAIHNGTIFTTQGYLIGGLSWSHLVISMNLSETQEDMMRYSNLYNHFFTSTMEQHQLDNRIMKRLLILRNINEEKYEQISNRINEVMNSFQSSDNVIGRTKRQIMVGLAALGGMLFGGAVTSLFSKFKSDTLYNVLEKRTNIISAQVERNTIQILQTETEIKRINDTIHYISNELDNMIKAEIELDQYFVGLLSTFIMDNQYQKITTLCNALDQLYNGKLHKGLITQAGLEKALTKIKRQAQLNGLISGVQNTHELYRIPTSFMYQPETKLLHIFVHIPMYHESHILTLYRFIPTPMPVLEEPQLMFVEIKPSEIYLARNRDGTLTRSLTTEELNSCLSLGHAYFCDNNALEKTNKPNCLNHLFNGLDQKSIQLCDGHLHPQISQIIRINQTTYLLAESEYTTITSECLYRKTLKSFTQKLHPGTFLITVDTNCTTTSDNWVITPSNKLDDVIVTSTITKNEIDPVHLLSNFSDEDLKLLHASMKLIGHPMPVSQLKGLSTFKSLLQQNRYEYWSAENIVTPTIGTILVIIVSIILYFFLRRRCKSTSTGQVSKSQDREEPIIRMSLLPNATPEPRTRITTSPEEATDASQGCSTKMTTTTIDDAPTNEVKIRHAKIHFI